jgi:SAM-dependent methyltransferase
MDESSKRESIRKAASSVLSQLPEPTWSWAKGHLTRACEELSWVHSDGGTLVDIGGSWGFHCAIAASAGMKTYCVDQCSIVDPEQWRQINEQGRRVAKSFGVTHIDTDLIAWEPRFEPQSIDVVMSFDCLEHLHHSPRRLFQRLMPALKPGGQVLIGAPNAVNLLKRFRLLCGRTIFEPLDNFWEVDFYEGHVREPTPGDLKAIGHKLGLHNTRVFGRNWLGIKKFGRLTLVDRLLRLKTSFCSDLYLLGVK